MSETQTEKIHLRPCPFCGGEPALNVTDDKIKNSVVTIEIRCKKCRCQIIASAVIVGSKVYNDVVHKMVMDWNRREKIPKNTAQLMNICGTLLDLSVLLERGLTIAQNLILNYFGNNKKVHEENDGRWLLYHYDEARVFSGIVFDYIHEALRVTDNLADSIDISQERVGGGKRQGEQYKVVAPLFLYQLEWRNAYVR